MLIFFVKWNDWLSKNMFIVVLSGLLLGSFINITDSPSIRKIVVALFAYMTFVQRKILILLTNPSFSFNKMALVTGIPATRAIYIQSRKVIFKVVSY